MVKFEESMPEKQPGLIKSQWFNDAGVRRGVEPEVAEDIGYKDPAKLEPKEADTTPPKIEVKPPAPKRYQTAAEKRLPHAKELLEQLRTSNEVRQAQEIQAAQTSSDRTLQILKETNIDEDASAEPGDTDT